MLKPLLVAAAALFVATPALAAPTLNAQSVYADKDISLASGHYGDVVYGTTESHSPFTPGKEPYDTLTKSTPADRAALTQAAKDASAYYLGLTGTPYVLTNDDPPKKTSWTVTGIAGQNVIEFTVSEIGQISKLLNVADTGITQLIFNIPGLDVNAALFELNLPAGLTSDKVLFNFYEATKVGGTNALIHGSILAPYAHVDISKITIDGIVISDRFDAANVQVLGNGFNFGPPVPEPATWALLILGFGVIGFAMRRRAVARPALAA